MFDSNDPRRGIVVERLSGHFYHARYGRAKAIVRLADGEIVSGELPLIAARLVRQWALARRAELQDNWWRARAHQPLEKIAGPDDDAD